MFESYSTMSVQTKALIYLNLSTVYIQSGGFSSLSVQSNEKYNYIRQVMDYSVSAQASLSYSSTNGSMRVQAMSETSLFYSSQTTELSYNKDKKVKVKSKSDNPCV